MTAMFTIFHAPGACSRVTLAALEECGIDYVDIPVDLWRAAHRTPEFLAVNPEAKVPALLVDGELLTENAAILMYLHLATPQAGLLPPSDDPLIRARQFSDLVACSSGWHPTVRAIRMPARLTTGDPQGVRAKGIEAMAPMADALERRVANDQWWYGDRWSIVDVYLHWSYSMAAIGGFDLAPYPAVQAHAERVASRPSFRRALAREEAAIAAAGVARQSAAR